MIQIYTKLSIIIEKCRKLFFRSIALHKPREDWKTGLPACFSYVVRDLGELPKD